MYTAMPLKQLAWMWFPPSGSPTAIGEEKTHVPFRPTTSLTDEVAFLLAEIQRLYDPVEPEILKFIEDRLFLLEIIYQTALVLRQIFGSQARLKLELASDPDTGEQELFALVHVPSGTLPEEALQKLREFDERWFVGVQKDVDGQFNVDVVFDTD